MLTKKLKTTRLGEAYHFQILPVLQILSGEWCFCFWASRIYMPLVCLAFITNQNEL